MPLQSELFRGDAKLEACLVPDSAHVTPGPAGEHVAKIQFALGAVDDLAIADAETSAQTYGSSTAAAILAFKRRRNIVNLSFQTQADSIVGKIRIARLGKAMFDTENQPIPVDVCLMTDAVARSSPPAQAASAPTPVAGVLQKPMTIIGDRRMSLFNKEIPKI